MLTAIYFELHLKHSYMKASHLLIIINIKFEFEIIILLNIKENLLSVKFNKGAIQLEKEMHIYMKQSK